MIYLVEVFRYCILIIYLGSESKKSNKNEVNKVAEEEIINICINSSRQSENKEEVKEINNLSMKNSLTNKFENIDLNISEPSYK